MLRTALADEWRSGGTLPLRRHPIDGQPEPTAGPDPALPGGAEGEALRPPDSVELCALAAEIPALSQDASSA